MQVVLHSSWFHIFVIILVLLDSVFVLVELLLEVGAFSEWSLALLHHAVKLVVVPCSLLSVELVV